jgi:hypothetical protein
VPALPRKSSACFAGNTPPAPQHDEVVALPPSPVDAERLQGIEHALDVVGGKQVADGGLALG